MNQTRLTTILTVGLALLASANSRGAVIYVSSSATGANNGSSWADAYINPQAALGVAVPGDEIWVAAGTYHPAPRPHRQLRGGMCRLP